jgi:hypothetical protein
MHDMVVSDASVGMPHKMPSFNAALWKFTSMHDAAIKERMSPAKKLLKHHRERPMPPHAPAKSLARDIKMLSLNPSVYGNVYGVLGSS